MVQLEPTVCTLDDIHTDLVAVLAPNAHRLYVFFGGISQSEIMLNHGGPEINAIWSIAFTKSLVELHGIRQREGLHNVWA